MNLDPDQVFVINAITRSGIAEDLQDIRTACNYKHPTGQQTIALDDERLTDELCQDYADALGQIDFYYSEESAEEASHNATCILLEAMGYVDEDDELSATDIERQEILEWIEACEEQLVKYRAQLRRLDEVNEPDHLQTPDSAF